MGMFARSKAMTAKDFCIICHHAYMAGVAGDVSMYGVPPDRSSLGDYQKHLDKVLPQAPKTPYYFLQLPISRRGGGGRTKRRIPVVPAHEALTDEMETNPPTIEDVHAAFATDEWNRSYESHPLKIDPPDGEIRQWPIVVYVDGVRFTRQTSVGKMDSFIGWSVYNLVTRKRILVALVRKSEMCRCGCRGWCTLFPVFQFLAWCFSALASGQRPPRMHDGAEWSLDDERRLPRQLINALLVMIKGDWAEFCFTFGLPSWSSFYHPCVFCDTMKANMYRFRGLSVLSTGWGDHDETATYEDSCRACEIHVRVADDQQLALLFRIGGLFYDKRKNGGMGRCLANPVRCFGLLRGDRLEPSVELPDVGDLRSARPPITLTFWRRHMETQRCLDRVLRRNPLFSAELGTSPQRTFAIDTLHTLYYGPIQRFVQCVAWRAIEGNPWGFRTGLEETLELGVARLRIDIFRCLWGAHVCDDIS
jgi:hypothetical protein